jgi:hypothetical protein
MLPAVLSLTMPPRATMAAAGIGARPRPTARVDAAADGPIEAPFVRRSQRVPHDFYPTPASAVRAFLAAETFDGSVWEPAAGDGAIAKELVAHGYDVTATDLIDRGYGRGGIDFLETIFPRGKHIITNPPYGSGLADAFVTHALKLAAITNGRVAMLLNLSSLCHPDRHAFWTDRPPSRLYALDECICWPAGKPEAATRFTRQHRYFWAVWEPETVPVSSTAFKWLATGPFTDRALRHAKRQTKQQQTERTTS